jgi:hypothetical protein
MDDEAQRLEEFEAVLDSVDWLAVRRAVRAARAAGGAAPDSVPLTPLAAAAPPAPCTGDGLECELCSGIALDGSAPPNAMLDALVRPFGVRRAHDPVAHGIARFAARWRADDPELVSRLRLRVGAPLAPCRRPCGSTLLYRMMPFEVGAREERPAEGPGWLNYFLPRTLVVCARLRVDVR